MSALELAECVRCNTPFAKRIGSLRKHCGDKCRKADKRDARPTYTSECAYPACHEEFTTTRKMQRYCSKECKKAHEAENFQKSLHKEKRFCAYELCGKSFIANKKERYCCREHGIEQKRINDRRRWNAQHNIA